QSHARRFSPARRHAGRGQISAVQASAAIALGTAIPLQATHVCDDGGLGPRTVLRSVAGLVWELGDRSDRFTEPFGTGADREPDRNQRKSEVESRAFAPDRGPHE